MTISALLFLLMTIWTAALTSVVLVSLISLVGCTMLFLTERQLRHTLFALVSLAAGGLFGDAFLHLLPEAYKVAPFQTASYALLGIVSMFLLEKVLHWQHSHNPRTRKPYGYLNLIADGIHNFIDGTLIGSSYMVSMQVGVSTTVAVILHEIPQEIADFGVLINSGFTRGRALFLNLLSATLAIGGAAAALLVGSRVQAATNAMVGVTAGAFIYIAGSDLVPELQEEVRPWYSVIQLSCLLVGMGLMLLLLYF